ncbi:NlpC/P60 family protein [Dactylosporangium sp. NPDC050688]|uniref:C40 family peptidase n=1 Tax=Dactylosporangium sp. NPDC050688 TaxID=3157217 RepID=UPI0033FC632A
MLCAILCTVTASGPARGADGDAGAAGTTFVSIQAPPPGVRSLAYHQQPALDAFAEVREIRAASRAALRERLTAAAATDRPAWPEAATVTGPAAGSTATGATTKTAAGSRPAGAATSRGRPRARPAGKATPRTVPGRQRPSAARATTARGTAPHQAAPRRPAARTMPPRPAPGTASGTALWTGAPAVGGDGVVGFALAQVGKGYGFGSAGPDRFDCSGLVAAAFRRAGISLPHQTGALARVGRPVGRGELRPGDLVFPSAGHVGIYIGGGRMVHASTERGGVKISPVYAFRFARRV